MNTFERGVADEMQRRAGPDPLVDDAAIFAAITHASPRWRFQSMFSATKFVVAGAIVALFGAFMFLGVLTQPSYDRLPAVGGSASTMTQAEPSDSATSQLAPTTAVEADTSPTTPDLLPGVDLVTQQVQPGVFRVTHDGVRSLHYAGDDVFDGSLTFGHDGSLWMASRGDFFRVGSGTTIETPEVEGHGDAPSFGALGTDVAVGSDGIVRAAHIDRLWVLEDERWQEDPDAPEGSIREVEIDSAGTGWVQLGLDTCQSQCLLRRDADGWTRRPGPGHMHHLNGGLRTLTLDADGLPWLFLPGRLWHDDGVELALVEPPGIPRHGYMRYVDVGTDGTLWASYGKHHLVRLVDDQWSAFSEADGVRDADLFASNQASPFEVASDGSIWAAYGWSCTGGVDRFDGSSWSTYLEGACVGDIAPAPDGSVWVRAWDPGSSSVSIFVITPEAVAASE